VFDGSAWLTARDTTVTVSLASPPSDAASVFVYWDVEGRSVAQLSQWRQTRLVFSGGAFVGQLPVSDVDTLRSMARTPNHLVVVADGVAYFREGGDPFTWDVVGLPTQGEFLTILRNNFYTRGSGDPLPMVDVRVPQAQRITIDVFDAMGELVARITDDEAAAGLHTFVWDTKNYAGQDVAPGIYFLHVASGDLDEARKIVITRQKSGETIESFDSFR
jgi:hypothetical protein